MDHNQDCARDRLGDIDHDGDGYSGDADADMDVADVSNVEKYQHNVGTADTLTCTSMTFSGRILDETPREASVPHQRPFAIKSYRSLSRKCRFCRFNIHHQKNCQNNSEGAQIIITESNQWMVRLLHLLLSTVKTCSEFQRLPDMRFLEKIPDLIDAQESWIKGHLGRQECSRMDEIKEENDLQGSIQVLLTDLYSHCDTYNKNVISGHNSQSSITSKRKEDKKDIMEQRIICVELDSQSSIETVPGDDLIIDISDEEDTQESVPTENLVIDLNDEDEAEEHKGVPLVINLGVEEDTVEQDDEDCL